MPIAFSDRTNGFAFGHVFFWATQRSLRRLDSLLQVGPLLRVRPPANSHHAGNIGETLVQTTAASYSEAQVGALNRDFVAFRERTLGCMSLCHG